MSLFNWIYLAGRPTDWVRRIVWLIFEFSPSVDVVVWGRGFFCVPIVCLCIILSLYLATKSLSFVAKIFTYLPIPTLNSSLGAKTSSKQHQHRNTIIYFSKFSGQIMDGVRWRQSRPVSAINGTGIISPVKEGVPTWKDIFCLPLKTNKLIYWIKILLRYSYWISDAFFYCCNIFILSATF